MKKSIFSVVYLIMLGTSGLMSQSRPSVNSPEIILNLPILIGKSPQVIRRVLGKPERIEYVSKSPAISKGLTFYYNNNLFEINFMNERAEFIYFVPPIPYPYSKLCLPKFGLPIWEPTIQNRFVIRWENINKIRELSIFPNNDGKSIDYVNIVVSVDPSTL